MFSSYISEGKENPTKEDIIKYYTKELKNLERKLKRNSISKKEYQERKKLITDEFFYTLKCYGYLPAKSLRGFSIIMKP
ncbi:MAG: hypothetical protein H0Z24_05560 [Thermosipho sp. (in: Bacteria)]|nr:hypothetical protein [Thermosipho sp. (in: thermotogales)]